MRLFPAPSPSLLIFSLIAFVGLSACTPQESQPEPVQADPTPAPVEPTEPEDQAAGWLTLKNQTHLPTQEELADGSDASADNNNSDDDGASRPSTSIKPPPSAPIDRLDSPE